MKLPRFLLAAFALCGGLSMGCGFLGTEQVLEKARSPKVMAVNEMNEDQRNGLSEHGLLDEGEGIIWYYDPSVTGGADSANVLTTERVGTYDKQDTYEVRFEDVVSAELDKGGTSERIRVEKSSGEFITLTFGLAADSARFFDSLCKKVGEERCSR
ncbi:MAG: hypothetical protein H6739_20110 [Alphaproteobacteria bacterium]|nr:hypothetical protein [Alphaproteobacteria bacterium]